MCRLYRDAGSACKLCKAIADGREDGLSHVPGGWGFQRQTKRRPVSKSECLSVVYFAMPFRLFYYFYFCSQYNSMLIWIVYRFSSWICLCAHLGGSWWNMCMVRLGLLGTYNSLVGWGILGVGWPELFVRPSRLLNFAPALYFPILFSGLFHLFFLVLFHFSCYKIN